jgi:hypothetical protein
MGDRDLKVLLEETCNIANKPQELKIRIREIMTLYDDLFFYRLTKCAAIFSRVLTVFEFKILNVDK